MDTFTQAHTQGITVSSLLGQGPKASSSKGNSVPHSPAHEMWMSPSSRKPAVRSPRSHRQRSKCSLRFFHGGIIDTRQGVQTVEFHLRGFPSALTPAGGVAPFPAWLPGGSRGPRPRFQVKALQVKALQAWPVPQVQVDGQLAPSGEDCGAGRTQEHSVSRPHPPVGPGGKD